MAIRKKDVKKISILTNTLVFLSHNWTGLLSLSLLGAVIWKLYRIYAVPALARVLGINLSMPYLPENIPLMPLTMLLLVTLVFAFFLCGLEQLAIILFLKNPKSKLNIFLKEFGRHLYPVTSIMLILLLILTAGLLLLIFPVFILAFFLQFSVYAGVLEKKSSIGALIKSAQLVKTNFLFVFLRCFFLWVFIIAIHLLTRQLLYTSIAYHTIIIPFIIIYNYFLFKSLPNK